MQALPQISPFRWFIILIFWVSGWNVPLAQVAFDSDNPEYFKYYGIPGQKVYESLAEALKKPEEVYKLRLHGEYLADKAHRLARLSRVQILDLDDNYLKELPATLGAMTGLMILVSRRNRIQYLSPELAKARGLMYMELYGTALDSVPGFFGQFQRLELLRIGPNYADTLRLSPSMAQMASLRDLQLLDCRLHRIPEWLPSLKNLERLVLIRCEIDTVQTALRQLTRLKALDLSGNRLRAFPKELYHIRNLEYLALRDNQLTEIPENILFLNRLQTLDLRGNPILPENLRLLQLALPRCRIIWEPPRPKN
ncbi:MAG: leucine-rich repeat domain-containing protein [Flavobacteriales bacterium]|nr:leucine-rich repeat domain-containing protein [Flavobacteriales bacterium]MDW8432967.1 leucine-rich repeat domain-containing protein [Flavobacteriales bacterium]